MTQDTQLLPSQRPVVGIDIGKHRHAAAAVDPGGRDFGKTILFDNNRAGIDRLEQEILAPMRAMGPVLVGMEATGHYWICLFFELERRGYELVVLNPLETTKRQRRRIRKTKTDKVDARSIARFVREGAFGRSRIPDEPTFELRLIVRHRWRLQAAVVQIQTAALTQIDVLFPELPAVLAPWLKSFRALLRNNAGLRPRLLLADADHTRATILTASRRRIANSRIDELLRWARDTIGSRRGEAVMDALLRSSLDLIEALERQIADLDRQLEARIAPRCSPLGSLGLSSHLIATIHAESDPIATFRNSRQFVAYAGLDPATFQSGDPDPRGGHVSKRGSRRLRQALYQAAMGLILRPGIFQDTYRRARKRGKHHLSALVKTASLLARIVFRLLHDNKPFDPNLGRARDDPAQAVVTNQS
jgi:transposase